MSKEIISKRGSETIQLNSVFLDLVRNIVFVANDSILPNQNYLGYSKVYSLTKVEHKRGPYIFGVPADVYQEGKEKPTIFQIFTDKSLVQIHNRNKYSLAEYIKLIKEDEPNRVIIMDDKTSEVLLNEKSENNVSLINYENNHFLLAGISGSAGIDVFIYKKSSSNRIQ